MLPSRTTSWQLRYRNNQTKIETIVDFRCCHLSTDYYKLITNNNAYKCVESSMLRAKEISKSIYLQTFRKLIKTDRCWQAQFIFRHSEKSSNIYLEPSCNISWNKEFKRFCHALGLWVFQRHQSDNCNRKDMQPQLIIKYQFYFIEPTHDYPTWNMWSIYT
jgi:hypothetical protein